MDIEIKEIAIRSLRANSGEVDGLPRNPRKISKKMLEKLKKSLRDAPEMLRLLLMMKDAGLTVRHMLIWRKNAQTFSLGRLDYDYQHEHIFYT